MAKAAHSFVIELLLVPISYKVKPLVYFEPFSNIRQAIEGETELRTLRDGRNQDIESVNPDGGICAMIGTRRRDSSRFSWAVTRGNDSGEQR